MDSAAFDYDPYYLDGDEYGGLDNEVERVKLDLKLQPKQLTAFNTEANEILYGGAAGGGKSHFIRVLAIWSCCNVPGIQVYLFRRKSPDLIKNHVDGPTGFEAMLADTVKSGGAKINRSDNTISFPNGSKIFLCHCQHEKDKINYQGAEIHLLLIDELTHFTETIYRYLRARVRLGGLKVPDEHKDMFPRIVSGSNPGGVGHNWVKLTFVDIAPPLKVIRTEKSEGRMLRQYIPARLDDNPALAANDPDYGDRLEGLGNPELVKAMRDGDWNIVAGGMFDDLWRTDVHVIEPFEIPSSWRVDRGFDWGSSKPFSVCWFAESDGTPAKLKDETERHFARGTIFQIAEWYGWNGSANTGCKMLAVDIAKGIKNREKELPMKIFPGPADSAIYATENGVCIAEDMESEDIEWTPADKSPGSRINGWERMREHFKGALNPLENRGFFVFSNCIHTIRTVPTLPRHETKTDDVDTDSEDHIADTLRYRISQAKPASTEQSFNVGFM